MLDLIISNNYKSNSDSATLKCVVFLRSNPIQPDPRVEKTARTLAMNGFKVIVVGWDREGLFLEQEGRDFGKICRIKIYAKFGKGLRNIFHLIKWQLALIKWLFKNRKIYSYIHACDFDTVIPAIICKVLLRKKVIYDIFDFYSDMLRNVPDFIKKVIRKIDLLIINKVDAVIIADESRVKQIKGSYPRKLEIIYNSPPKILDIHVEEKKGKSFLVCYVGLLQKERGIIEMINVIRKNPTWKLILAGYGGDEDLIKEACKGIKNIEFLGRVTYENAIKIYSISDLMFATYDPSIPNHKFSSANKLFEAMMLGKPIIVAKGTGMDTLVTKYKLGFIVDYGDESQLEAVLKEIEHWDIKERNKFSERVKQTYLENFAWEIMEERLINLYNEIY